MIELYDLYSLVFSRNPGPDVNHLLFLTLEYERFMCGHFAASGSCAAISPLLVDGWAVTFLWSGVMVTRTEDRMFFKILLVCVSSWLVLSCLTLCGGKKKKKNTSSAENKAPAPKVASPKKEQKSEKKEKSKKESKEEEKSKKEISKLENSQKTQEEPKSEKKPVEAAKSEDKNEKSKKEPEKKEKSKKENIKLENSQKTQASSRSITVLTGKTAMNREVEHIQIGRLWIYISGSKCISENHDLNKNPQTAQLEIANFLKTISTVYSISWAYCDIDDAIAKELTRIQLEREMDVGECRVTASLVQTELLLATHPKKISLSSVQLLASIVTDQTLSLLKGDIRIYSISPAGSSDLLPPTDITDNFLKSLQLEFEANKRSDFYTRVASISLGSFNPKLSFSAIKDFIKSTYRSLRFRQYQYLGIFGYQEMNAILQYYHEKSMIEWNSKIFNINGISRLQFCNIFEEGIQFRTNDVDKPIDLPSFSISLDRDSNGKVDDIMIPEEFIVASTFNTFKALVQVIQSDIPLKSIEPASIGLKSLEFFHFDDSGYPTLEVRASIIQQPNIRKQKSHPILIRRTNVDMFTSEEIFVKIFKICSSIEFSRERGTNIILNDKLFTLLSEHAKDTEITKTWSMDVKLSAENLARLRENQGLFKMFKLNEASNI